ncbi:hypothetical protein ACTMSW_24890 [Micromonospora sp. BQ11]|uniref:hypothetical protein n=1 Tax=Micromonospora sp. BQ11 TaxID=3452212 RepID=UPI003F887143
MRIIEGTVDEIIEYQTRTNQGPPADDDETAAPEKEATPTRSTSALDSDDEETFFIKQFVYTRAKDGGTANRVLTFLNRALDLKTVAAIGESDRTHDGYTDYIMVRDEGPKKYGAVVYVKPANGGLTLRLRPEDVADLDSHRIKLRNVAPTQKYAVNCPLNDDEAVDLALLLTERALDKVRGN